MTRATREQPAAGDAALDALAQQLPAGRLLRDPASRLVYARDASQERGTPAAIALPESTVELQTIARWASRHGRALVARGAGTGLAGGAVGRGAVTVSLARMRRLDVDPTTRTAVVGPGVTRDAVDAAAAAHGLAYPPDPSSGVSSTVGGNVACNAGGPHCLSRGVTQRWVAGLGVVLADGRLVHLGGRAVDTPGPDWTALFVGSEGTLGLITEITLRLAPRRPAKRALLAAFPDVTRAGAAVTAVLAAGLRPAAVELMDQRIMRIIEDWIAPGLPVEAGAALLLEVDGRASTLDASLAAIAEILRAEGCSELRQARDDAQTAALWRGRKSAGGAMSRLAPAYYSVDVTVPRGALAAALAEVEGILAEAGLPAGYVAHVGDGNLHPLLPLDPADPEDRARIEAVARAIARMAVRRGGSITGEHGVGREKRALLALQLDAATRGAMGDLRTALDPRGVLNPGAVLDAEEEGDAGAAESPPESAATSHPTLRIDAADFVLHAPADTPVARAVAAAEAAGRRLPLIAPWPEATLRELLDANLAPPNRHADGAPRDLLLAATVTLPDGRAIHAGRAVHKNVAGYDLHRLLVGARGALGRFDAVSLALAPPDRLSRSLIVPTHDLRTAVALAERWASHTLEPRSVVVVRGSLAGPVRKGSTAPWHTVLTAAGEAPEVDAEIEAARALIAPPAGVSSGGRAVAGTTWKPSADASESTDPVLSGTAMWARALGASRARAATGGGHGLRITLPPSTWTAVLGGRHGPRLARSCLILDAVNGQLYASSTDHALPAALREIARRHEGHCDRLFDVSPLEGDGAAAATPSGDAYRAWLTSAVKRAWGGSGQTAPSRTAS